MPDNEKMLRVSRKNPCPVCSKFDWCLVAEDNSTAICARIEEGSVKRCGDAGYLHILADRPKSQQYRSQRRFSVGLNDKPDGDFTALQQQYSRQMTSQQFDDLSQQLGVSTQSIKQLRVGWDGQAYTFPMSNPGGQIIGIRRRFPNGRKISLTGSKTGLFLPVDLSPEGLLLICEGPTDTAAALDLGLNAIGRPNCNSRIDMTVEFCKGRSEIIVVGDNDPPKENGRRPGKEGAEKMAGVLVLHSPCVKIIYPPDGIKDLRQWLRAGLNPNKLLTIIEDAKPLTMELR